MLNVKRETSSAIQIAKLGFKPSLIHSTGEKKKKMEKKNLGGFLLGLFPKNSTQLSVRREVALLYLLYDSPCSTLRQRLSFLCFIVLNTKAPQLLRLQDATTIKPLNMFFSNDY